MARFSLGFRKRRARPSLVNRQQQEQSASWVTRLIPGAKAKDPYLLELQKRRQAVADQYWRDKRRLLKKKNYARKDLRAELERRKEEAERYYRLHELADDDPRRSRAERKAEKRYEERERKLERKYDDTWQKALNKLQSERDKERRSLPKQLKREFRADGQLPNPDSSDDRYNLAG